VSSVLRRGEHDTALDPSGWERRILSPVLPGVEFELMRTSIPGGVDAGEFSAHAPGSREYLAMERGRLRLTLDGVEHVLRAGDSVYYAGDCRHAFAKPGRRAVRVLPRDGARPAPGAGATADAANAWQEDDHDAAHPRRRNSSAAGSRGRRPGGPTISRRCGRGPSFAP